MAESQHIPDNLQNRETPATHTENTSARDAKEGRLATFIKKLLSKETPTTQTLQEIEKADVEDRHSNYYDAYIKQHKDANSNIQEQKVLEDLLQGIDRQGIKNVRQFTHEGNGFLMTSVNINEILTNMGAIKPEDQTNNTSKEKIDVFSFGGHGSPLAGNWNHLYMQGEKWAIPVANSNGNKEVNCHAFSDVIADGGKVNLQMAKNIAMEKFSPLGKLYAEAAKDILEKGDNQTKRIIINGFSQGGNIAIEMARELGVKFEDPNNKRLGHLDLPNGQTATVQILLDNPANVDQGFNPNVILGARTHGKEHKSEFYQMSNPGQKEFNDYLLSQAPNLQPESDGQKHLKKVAQAAMITALLRGTESDDVAIYKRNSLDNPIGKTTLSEKENRQHEMHMKEAREKFLNQHSDNSDGKIEPKDSKQDDKTSKQSEKDFNSVIAGTHLAIQERQAVRSERAARVLNKIINKRRIS